MVDKHINKFTTIRNLISSNEVESAIAHMESILEELNICSPNGVFYHEENSLILLSAQFKELRTESIRGTLPVETFLTIKSRLRASLLQLVKDIEQKSNKPISKEILSKSIKNTQPKEIVDITSEFIKFLEFSPDELEKLMEKLKNLLETDDIGLEDVIEGSTKLRIKIPQDKVELLKKSIGQGKLKEFGIGKVERWSSMIAERISNFINTLQEKNLMNQEETLSRREDLKRMRIEQKIREHEIAKIKEKHRIEIEKLKSVQEREIENLKHKAEEELEDYKEFLSELNILKDDMLKLYSHVPKVMIYTIYYHAKEIINNMWSVPISERKKYEKQLIEFMGAIHQDILNLEKDENKDNKFPEKSISYINEERQ